uniref:BZIP domain-containing protein n=1 Tax=Myotis lucifugus TaxID=59463 RepID=G1Q6L5_MYOLU
MARPVSDRTPAPLLLGGPAGAPPGGGLLGLRSLLQGTSKPKEPASYLSGSTTQKYQLPSPSTARTQESRPPSPHPPPSVLLPGSRAGSPGPIREEGLGAPNSRKSAQWGFREKVEGAGFPVFPREQGGLDPWRLRKPEGAREPGPAPCQPHTPAPRESSPNLLPAPRTRGHARGGGAWGLTSRDTPSPVDPDTVEVLMTFEPDPADLALSSIPGHETFDPRRHRFSEEELKPQPIMKKARKIQVPEEQKDEKYWSRRYKNNEAAKRSRDARRLKENQISVRAAFLEKENALLRQEVVAVRQELSHYRAVLSRYQAQHGAL